MGTEVITSTVGAAIGKGLLFGLLGLIAGIVLVIACARLKVFAIDNRLWNITRKLIYLYIPILCIVFFSAYGAVKSVDNRVTTNLDQISKPILTYAKKEMPTLQSYLTENWKSVSDEKKSLEDFIGEFLAQFYYKPKTDGFYEKNKAKVINYFTLNAGKWILTSVAVSAAASAIAKAGEPIGIEKDDIKSGLEIIMKMDISQFDKTIGEVFVKALYKVKNRTFKGIYQSIAMPFLLLLLVPFALRGLYFGYEKIMEKRSGQLQQ